MNIRERKAFDDWHSSDQRMAQHRQPRQRDIITIERLGQTLLLAGVFAILLWLTGPDYDAFLEGVVKWFELLGG